MGKLSTKKVRALKTPGRYGDGDGLYLHIRPGGSQQWVLRVTVRGKRTDIGLGSTSTVTLAEAREKSNEMRRVAKRGANPLAERRRQSTLPTYREVTERVWNDHRPTWKNPKHADQWINTQEQYVFPYIGDLRIDEITASDVLKVLSPIWLAKEETARRVRQRMRVVFDWAKVAAYREGDNPIEGIERALPPQKRKVVHQPALQWERVPDFYCQLRDDYSGVNTANAYRFLILTAMRSSEVRLSKWDEIDLDQRLWIVPADRMKMKKPHRVPLSDEAVDILRSIPRAENEFLFLSPTEEKPLSENAFAALQKRIGRTGFTAHGFRSSFRDWSSDNQAASWEVVEAALAHASGNKTEQAYARSDLFERRRDLMQKWAVFVSG